MCYGHKGNLALVLGSGSVVVERRPQYSGSWTRSMGGPVIGVGGGSVCHSRLRGRHWILGLPGSHKLREPQPEEKGAIRAPWGPRTVVELGRADGQPVARGEPHRCLHDGSQASVKPLNSGTKHSHLCCWFGGRGSGSPSFGFQPKHISSP